MLQSSDLNLHYFGFYSRVAFFDKTVLKIEIQRNFGRNTFDTNYIIYITIKNDLTFFCRFLL